MNINLAGRHNKAETARAVKKVTWVSVLVNVILSSAQIVLGFFSRSQALIADGIHSLSDLVADFLVLLAAKEGQKEADERHPYGHHRYENAATMALGILLLLLSFGMIYSAFDKFRQPESITQVHSIALYAALITLFVKEGLFRYMIAVANRVRSGMLVANAYHARSDAASSLLVAVGIGGNLAGLPILDPVAALCVGLLIIRSGWQFFIKGFNDLTDESANEETVQKMIDIVQTLNGVYGVHNVRSRKSGDWIVMDIDIDVPETFSVREGHDIAIRARDVLMSQFPVLSVNIHIDPVTRHKEYRLPETN